jgi:hypothetical protein
MNMITRKAKLSMKEFQLIETRIADTNALTTTLPEHLTQCLESYVDKSDEAMMNIVSRTEAEAAFMSSDYEFTTEQIQLLLNASMEHVEDPNSVLYKKLVAKAVKLYRFNFVVNQLGSTSARRAAGYAADPDMGMSSIAEDSEASMDPHAAFLNSMQGGPNPPASHNLPPLRIQEAIATRHLQVSGSRARAIALLLREQAAAAAPVSFGSPPASARNRAAAARASCCCCSCCCTCSVVASPACRPLPCHRP